MHRDRSGQRLKGNHPPFITLHLLHSQPSENSVGSSRKLVILRRHRFNACGNQSLDSNGQRLANLVTAYEPLPCMKLPSSEQVRHYAGYDEPAVMKCHEILLYII
jgi:hypothetical protein